MVVALFFMVRLHRGVHGPMLFYMVKRYYHG